MGKAYIIAEAGVNHNGSVEMALALIEAAKACGADCIKFQTFKASQIVTALSPKASYQLLVTDSTESQYEMLKKLELGFGHYAAIIEHCKKFDIHFLSTPYNYEDVDFLENLNVDSYKIASGQLTEIPFLKYVASKGKTIYLSTGMGTMADVFDAVEAIRSVSDCEIVVLQCTTNYPSRIEDTNLRAMASIKEACKVRVGYSDHVDNNYASFAAVALGAEIIEKHFTLDKTLEGPDHTSSLTPHEFKELVIGVRSIEKAMGDGIKRPSEAEIKNSYGMKRSLVLIQDVEAGTVLSDKMIGFKRPSNGLPVSMIDLVLGKKLVSALKKDDPLQYNSVEW